MSTGTKVLIGAVVVAILLGLIGVPWWGILLVLVGVPAVGYLMLDPAQRRRLRSMNRKQIGS
jgi:hypothetical protein